MPADYGEISAYHRREAARHQKLAQEARDLLDDRGAEYQLRLAATHLEALQGQKAARSADLPQVTAQATKRWPPDPRSSFAITIVNALLPLARALGLVPREVDTRVAKPSKSHVSHWPANAPTPHPH